jgi:hypothetical protein
MTVVLSEVEEYRGLRAALRGIAFPVDYFY